MCIRDSVESIAWYNGSGELLIRGEHSPLTVAIEWEPGMDRMDVVMVVTDKDGNTAQARSGGLALRCAGTSC